MTTRDVGPPITDLGPLSCDECPVDDRSYDDNGRVCARGWREFNDAPHAVFDEVYPGWRQLPPASVSRDRPLDRPASA